MYRRGVNSPREVTWYYINDSLKIIHLVSELEYVGVFGRARVPLSSPQKYLVMIQEYS